ncbi:GntR family transcriptional regulator [Sulfolobales archaeon HS-7]|nr:GntR family transcriptional regulator [Sulfolobales archaeon HS-7]
MSGSLAKAAYDEILKRIVEGKYKLGEVLTEDSLTLELNMSRTPIREALRILEKEGLIRKTNRSYTVLYLTPEEIEKLYEVRIELEGLAAKLATVRASERELQDIQNILDDIKETTFSGKAEPVTLAELNGTFHDFIARASENEQLRECLINIRLKLRVVRMTLFTSFDRMNEEYEEHRDIFNAIKSRNPDDAYKLMISHETNVLEYLRKRIFPLYKA